MRLQSACRSLKCPKAVAIGLLASWTLCFSIAMPRALAVVLLGSWVVAGDTISSFLLNGMANPSARALARWVLGYLPDFAKLDMITRYTDGIGALAPGEFGGLVLYGLVCIGFALALAVAMFRRKVL